MIRCKECHEILTWKEEIYNQEINNGLCDDCLQIEKEAFIYKGGGNDESTAKEE